MRNSVKVSTFIDVLSEEGVREALATTADHVYWTTKAELFNITVSDEIIDQHCRKMLVEGTSEEVVEYTGIHETVPELFVNHLGQTVTNEKYLRSFSDASVIGPHGLIGCDNRLILPSTIGWKGKNRALKRKFAKQYPFRSPISNRTKQRRELDDCFLLRSRYRGFNNFGLWLYEALPKLYWYNKFTEVVGDTPTIVTPPLREYQRKTLRQMGYQPDEFVEFTNEILTPSRLIVPPQPGHCSGTPWHMSARSVNWVRSKLTGTMEPGRFPERIYISREDAKWRAVSNENQVMDLLENYGFAKFVLSELDIIDQIELFAGADVVVGPHGAGNGHMIHATDADWLEMFPGKEAARPFYFVLANRMSHNYEYLVAEPDGFQHPTKRAPRHRDMRVDVAELEAVINAMLDGTSEFHRSHGDLSHGPDA